MNGDEKFKSSYINCVSKLAKLHIIVTMSKKIIPVVHGDNNIWEENESDE